jgi:hypothetical protein
MNKNFQKQRSHFPFGKKLYKIIKFLYNTNEVKFMKKIIDRPYFLESLKKFKEVDIIKVVTGVRRSRKIYTF